MHYNRIRKYVMDGFTQNPDYLHRGVISTEVSEANVVEKSIPQQISRLRLDSDRDSARNDGYELLRGTGIG